MRFIHCADIHLDSPMETHLSAEQASKRNTEIIRSFVRMTEYARDNDVRAVIISGDLFDSERVRTRTLDVILSAMRKTPMVDYLYLTGNHDAGSALFTGRDLPPNLKCFGTEWTTYIYDPDDVNDANAGNVKPDAGPNCGAANGDLCGGTALNDGTKRYEVSGSADPGFREAKCNINDVSNSDLGEVSADQTYDAAVNSGAAKSVTGTCVAISGIKMNAGNAASLYDNIPIHTGAINIVALHGQTGTVSGIDRISLNLLKDKGIDYLALGHIHAYQAETLDDRGIYVYPGCLEGRGFDECGAKGFVLITAEDGHISHEFMPFSYRQLHRLSVDISGLYHNSEIIDRMKEAAAGIDPRDMVEFVLTGYSDPTADISIDYLADFFGDSFFFSKVKNESLMAIDPEAYKNDISLKGEFIRQVLASDMTEEDKAAVIRAGIQALRGEGVEI